MFTPGAARHTAKPFPSTYTSPTQWPPTSPASQQLTMSCVLAVITSRVVTTTPTGTPRGTLADANLMAAPFKPANASHGSSHLQSSSRTGSIRPQRPPLSSLGTPTPLWPHPCPLVPPEQRKLASYTSCLIDCLPPPPVRGIRPSPSQGCPSLAGWISTAPYIPSEH